MKKVLLKAFLLTIISFGVLNPLQIAAQCSCAGGTPANRIEHLVVLSPTSQSNTTISFPKFDPAIGTLSCVTLNDTLSIVSGTGIRNYDPIATEYEFQLTVNTKIEGPSLTRTNFKNVQYGPDILDAFGSAGDSINYGPDTVYNRFASARTNTSNMTPYLGSSGTVDFTYTIGGGVIAVGGANYNSQVRTTTWGTFKLTYLWCENAVLASSVRNLAVSRAGETIRLEWAGPENSSKENFNIQISTDGTTFNNLEQGTSTDVIKSPPAKYKYQYKPDQPVDRKLYFRVKYEKDGQVTYSEMKWLMPEQHEGEQMAVYPNPAIRAIRLVFKDQISGEVDVAISNQVGQPYLQRKARISNNGALELTLNEAPPAGIYFVKVVKNGSSKVYSSKLLFSR